MDVPDWFVEHLKRTGEWGEPKSRPRKRQVRESDSESDKDVMRAFTVKPVWGWLIMKGIKDVENRWNGVQPPKGVCAVSFSKTYGRAEHEELLEYVDRKNRKLIPPFEELKKLCGKVVGIVGYEVRTSYKSKWWNKNTKFNSCIKCKYTNTICSMESKYIYYKIQCKWWNGFNIYKDNEIWNNLH